MDLNKLHKIDEELTKSEVAALKFLCMDHLGRKRLESVKDAKDLFLRFTEQDLLMDKLFLPDLLYTIRRYDLLPILDTNKTHVSKQLEYQSSGVSLYRKMLYELSENVTDENLRDIKFLLHNLPKAKMASATFLEVLAEMEKTEMLGKDNLGALEHVLSNCSKELAYRVQRFKKASEITNPVYISTPGQDEENHLPVQPQDEFLPNMSIAETNPEFSPVTSSLSIESMDTDSQKFQASETSPANEINVDDCYPMTQRPVGYCLIINNHIFHPSSNLGERKGTHADKDSLTEVFQRMHFKVEERRDLLSSDMLKTVKEFSEKDHSKMDAFVCCILSHGEKGTVLGTDGKPVLIRDLTKPFACCKMLTGKPKLFFIQACQGNKLQSVWDEDGTEDDQFEYDAERAVLKSVPIEADFLIGMATVESYKSFRHVKTGSIFIQELCKYLQLGCSRNEDILSILTRVNSSVSEKELNYCKQMPEPRYTLTKKLVLPMD
ncbi:caspase-8 isoform X1 [Tachysurus vachellii]|uniref:caspase-8 isoform X1 n=1 Tax=Tachysurus vachellii TaxID=175792 RepID=UPI00296A9555|nr:caspase-8 isoform X1 [Tachysurus vachellii]XP_060724636.1 caspase-8 isoform X1 [Tachysurus vachellii]